MSSRPPKRRKLTPPPQSEDGVGNGASDVKIQKQFFKNASIWNLEKAYESRPKKGKKDKKDKKKAAKENRLPVKTAAGTWAPQDDVASIASDAEWLESEGDGEGQEEEEAPKPVVEEPKIPEREQVRRAQEELAKIATQLNEDPEEHPGAFKALAKIAESRSLAVKKLCLVTQMAVYKDVIPGYRIRPATEEPAGEKLSKDVKRLRTYEQALVSGYHGYIKSLAHHATSPAARGDRPGQSIANIALTCACTLLNAVPHFNFRGDLLRILVRKLSTRKIDADFAKCRQAIETLYQEDEEGRPSMEATSLLTKMMKAKEYRVDESVLNLFLHLRLLSEFHGKASQDKVNRPDAAQPNGKKGQQKKEFRTKKERKLLKEQKAAEKVMAAADATVSHEERDQMQSETLKMVFATYFRVLKQRSPHLMGAVLEGLAKYAHLINQDFFGDLLEALKDLINYSEKDEEEDQEEDEDDDDKVNVVRDTSREALLCTVTAFALLAGQDAHNARADLHLDLSFFITNLYRSLLALSVNPDVELGAKSLHASDPDDVNGGKKFKVNVQTTTVLLLRCLHGTLLPPWNIRQVPPLRLAAFAKQLMTSSLHMPEKSTQAVLTLLQDVIHTHGRKINALWNTEERKGDGTFNPLSETVEGSNPFTTTVWEGEILRKHYCPKVREGLKQMEKDLASI